MDVDVIKDLLRAEIVSFHGQTLEHQLRYLSNQELPNGQKLLPLELKIPVFNIARFIGQTCDLEKLGHL